MGESTATRMARQAGLRLPNLGVAGGVSLRTRSYSAGFRQAPHRDQGSRISAVLAGGFSEQTHHGSVCCARGDLLLKSNAICHENVFADRPTRILSIEFETAEDGRSFPVFRRMTWQVMRHAGALRKLTDLLEALASDNAPAVEALVLDIVVTFDVDPVRRPPPQWLRRVADELQQVGLSQVSIAKRAQQAGVHPVHASRLFRASYGQSVTDYARYHAVRRALAAMERSEAGLCDVSFDAGFFDQSHMTRAFRRVLSRPPSTCRGVFAAG